MRQDSFGCEISVVCKLDPSGMNKWQSKKEGGESDGEERLSLVELIRVDS